MADLERLLIHLDNVRLFARIRSIEDYRAMRKRALGACNKLLQKVPGEEAKGYVREVKRQIKEVRYSGK